MKNFKNMGNKLMAGAVFAGVGMGSFAGISGAFDGAHAATTTTSTKTVTKNFANGPQHTQDLSKLAKTLGVTEAQLKTAMDTVHKNHKPSGEAPKAGDHGNRDAELAKKLGVTEAKLKTVLEANKPTSKGSKPDFAKIAKELGVTEAKVKEAFTPPAKPAKGEAPKEGAAPKTDGFAKDLAKALNLSESKVAAALKSSLPAPQSGDFRGGPRGGHGPGDNSNGGDTPAT